MLNLIELNELLDSLMQLGQKENMELVGVDAEKRKYYYAGNQVFVRILKGQKEYREDSFDVLELPATDEKNGNIPKITVIPSEQTIKFYSPQCCGYDTLMEIATKDENNEWKTKNSFSKIADALATSVPDTTGNDKKAYGTALCRLMNNVYTLVNNNDKPLILSKIQ